MSGTPLIAYCCFGESYARMLHWSLHSLFDAGRYEGQVLVLSDLDAATLETCCPMARSARVEIVRVEVAHELTAKLARYGMHLWADLSRYAPILYADCDIVFDRPVAAMLGEVEAADAVCFPSEPNSNAMWGSMGGDFLRAEGIEIEGSGFNSGTMGIPDGASVGYGRALERVTATALELWVDQRDKFDRWIDQPVANYLQARFNLFDTSRLTSFFRFCFQHDDPDAAHGLRTGAVHFFDFDKESRMRDYLGRITSMPLVEPPRMAL